MSLEIFEMGQHWAIYMNPQTATKEEKDEFMKILYKRDVLSEMLYFDYVFGNDADEMFQHGVRLNNISWFAIDYAIMKEKIDLLEKNQDLLFSMVNANNLKLNNEIESESLNKMVEGEMVERVRI
ncbi:hypothetical protein [Methanolapillus africanus]